MRVSKVRKRSGVSLWVVASVHPESLPATGSKGHDINAENSERLYPLKFRLCFCFKICEWSDQRPLRFRVSFLVPLPSPLQSRFELHPRLVAQNLPRQRYVRLRIAYIATPRHIILRLNRLSRNARKHFQYLVQSNPRPSPSVEHQSRSFGRLARTQRLVHYIFHVSEIARLFPVSIDHRRLSLDH